MAFLESPAFPKRVAFGFSGGAGYNTSRGVLPSGWDKRNIDREDGLGKWVASQNGKSEAATAELIAFKRVLKGRGHAFRFPDWTDYKVTASDANGAVQLISGNDYQMYKLYDVGGALTELRIIQKPRGGTVVVLGGGTYTIDYTTGIITRVSGAAPTGWTGEFDVPCIFGDDDQNISIVGKKPGSGEFIYSWGNISVEEIPL